MWGLIQHAFNVLFKKNCRRCKHCYLYSVPSVGDGATYKCDIAEKNRTIRKGIENKIYPEEKYELMKKWGEYYVEDDVYHFVNYDL